MGVGKTVSNSTCFFVVLPLLGAFLPRAVPTGTHPSRPAWVDQGGLAPLASRERGPFPTPCPQWLGLSPPGASQSWWLVEGYPGM